MNKGIIDVITASIKAEVKGSIKYMVSAGMDVSEADQLSRAYSSFQRKFTAKLNGRRFSARRVEYQKEMDRLWLEIKPDIASTIADCLRKSRVRKMTKEIRAAAAKGAITSAMEEAGLTYQVEYQTYRAKVSVLVSEKSKITFYINYKKMTEEIPQAISAAGEIIRQVSLLGKGASLSKAFRYESWL